MPSTLGKYTLLQTLGKGAHSKVKLAINSKTREYYAVKILKKQNKNIDQKFMDLVITEVQALSVLHHSNIVNMVEFSNEGMVVKQNGSQYPVIYIVLELATGGEFFDYIATGGRFPENIARFYFRQLIEALYYVHKKGATHRDLKPENLLFDKQYNLKIADFGFAAPIQGRDGSGTLKTKLGTESYMAPEINLKKPYNGASVDLFACGIILFIMITQHPPFTKAIPDDPYYKLICLNKEDIFWKAHARNKPNGEAFFSEEFKDLINNMLQFEPESRFTIEQIASHPWYKNGSVATLEEIQQEFANRKVLIDQENENKRQAKEQERNQKKEELAKQKEMFKQQMGNAKKVYTGMKVKVTRGDGSVEEIDAEEEQKEEISKERVLDEYFRIIQKQTELFSTFEADVVLKALIELAEKQGLSHTVAEDKYKIKIMFIIGEGKKASNLEITAKILKVNEEKICIDFTKNEGDIFTFHKQFKIIRDYLGELIDTTYE